MTRRENAKKKDLKENAKLMIEELSKPPFNEKTNLKSVLKSLNFYFNIESSMVFGVSLEYTENQHINWFHGYQPLEEILLI